MKRASVAIVAAVALAALVLCLVWVWGKGEPAPRALSAARVVVLKGSVEIQRDGQWMPADDRALQQGDRVRTMPDAEARIDWADAGETRLDPGTELVVDQESRGFGMRLERGRIWSRVLKLLDLDAEARITTNAVVATVRGTAFGIAANATTTEAAVTESVVDLQRQGGDRKDWPLREGRWGRYAKDGKGDVSRDLRPDDAWPAENRTEDDQAVQRWKEEWKAEFSKNDKSGAFDRLGESLRLSVASDEEIPALRAAYASRRIASAVTRWGTAGERILRDRSLIGGLGTAQRLAVAQEAERAIFILEADGVVAEAPTLKLLREWRSDLMSMDPASSWHVSAVEVDESIDDLVAALPPVSERARRVAEILGRIDALASRLKDVDAGDPDRAARRAAKVRALRERIRGVGFETAPADAVPDLAVPTSTSAVPTSTVPAVEPTSDPSRSAASPQDSKPPVATGCKVQRIAVFVKPSTQLVVGQPGTLSVLAACADGTSKDATASASFAADPIASISGSSVTLSRAGSAAVRATVMDGSAAFAASVAVTAVEPKASLSAVRVTAVGSADILGGQTLPLQASAVYDDGKTATVTAQCRWGVSDATMGAARNGQFQAYQKAGDVNVFCNYTEGGVSKIGNLAVHVAIEAVSAPSTRTSAPNTQTTAPSTSQDSGSVGKP